MAKHTEAYNMTWDSYEFNEDKPRLRYQEVLKSVSHYYKLNSYLLKSIKWLPLVIVISFFLNFYLVTSLSLIGLVIVTGMKIYYVMQTYLLDTFEEERHGKNE